MYNSFTSALVITVCKVETVLESTKKKKKKSIGYLIKKKYTVFVKSVNFGFPT